MKQKIIIGLVLAMLVLATFFMVRDFFYELESDQGNPYEYDLSEYKKVDQEQVCADLVAEILPVRDNLRGIALDNKDRLYLADDNGILIYDKSGQPVSKFVTGKKANCLAISDNGNIYLGITDHVEVWDFSGNLLDSWDPLMEKTLITSLAVDEEYLYIADAGNKVVLVCDLDGNLQKTIGRRNKEKGIPGFFIPSPYFDLLLGREGELWVVNPGRHQFERYNEKGEMVSSWAKTSMRVDGFSGCCNPSHIAMLSNGSFVTSEKGIERVKIHLPSGEFHCLVAGPDQFDEETIGLDLAVDSRDRIYVMDPKRKNIRIYAMK